jgi:hypothetical protein
MRGNIGDDLPEPGKLLVSINSRELKALYDPGWLAGDLYFGLEFAVANQLKSSPHRLRLLVC